MDTELLAPEGTSPRTPHLLVVATVSITIRNFLIPYAAHFRALGWTVDAAATGVSMDPAIRGAFDHVYELPLSRSLTDLVSLLRGTRAISKILKSQPDIVHVHTPIAAFVTRLVIRRTSDDRRPVVAYTAHGFHFHEGGHAATNAFYLLAEKVAGRWTDRLIVMNGEDYDAARRHKIVAGSRLLRMPGIGVDTDWYSRAAIDPEELTRIRRAFRVGPSTPLFVSVAELSRRKRGADIIKALAQMKNREAILILAGEGPERRRLEDLADHLGVRNRVHFAGFIADVRALVASATALVIASDREGLARAVMESLSLGVPVIASTAKGNPELVGTDSGSVFSIGDVGDLASRMDWLIEHPVERRTMGDRGRVRMVEAYDLRILVRMHDEMYAAMLASRGRSGGRA